jgi:hypothetical protein
MHVGGGGGEIKWKRSNNLNAQSWSQDEETSLLELLYSVTNSWNSLSFSSQQVQPASLHHEEVEETEERERRKC